MPTRVAQVSGDPPEHCRFRDSSGADLSCPVASVSAALIAEAGKNYLTAISTPFEFILFYEVLILIAALPASTTRSIAHQFEIVSLIFIRDVFRDIASTGGLVMEHRLSWEALPVFVDMWSGFLMFFWSRSFSTWL